MGALFDQAVDPVQVHVGDSSQGRPIDGYLLGTGPATVVVAGGTRELADGVGPNRNVPTHDGTPATYGPGTWPAALREIVASYPSYLGLE